MRRDFAGPGADADVARRRAAEAVLQQGLCGLGIDLQGLPLVSGAGGGNGSGSDHKGSEAVQEGNSMSGTHQGQLMHALEQGQRSSQRWQEGGSEGLFGGAQPLSVAQAPDSHLGSGRHDEEWAQTK